VITLGQTQNDIIDRIIIISNENIRYLLIFIKWDVEIQSHKATDNINQIILFNVINDFILNLVQNLIVWPQILYIRKPQIKYNDGHLSGLPFIIALTLTESVCRFLTHSL